MASAAAGRLAPPASVHVSAGLLRDGATVIRRGRGVIVKNDRDRESIEAAVGLWCVNVGHGCREIVHAAAKQMNELAFFHTFNDVTNEPIAKLSARVLDCAPPAMRGVFFGNSGSDANYTAIKQVALYNDVRGKKEKRKIIARWRARDGGLRKSYRPARHASIFRFAPADSGARRLA